METIETKQLSSFWGRGIAILCTTFVVFILSLVWFTSCQDFDLVEGGYYEKELAYQQQIDRMERTRLLTEDVRVYLNNESRTLTIEFPDNILTDQISGSIQLYKPSDAKQDRSVALALDETNRHEIDVTGYSTGLWRVYVNWESGGLEYYTAEMIVIPGGR